MKVVFVAALFLTAIGVVVASSLRQQVQTTLKTNVGTKEVPAILKNVIDWCGQSDVQIAVCTFAGIITTSTTGGAIWIGGRKLFCSPGPKADSVILADGSSTATIDSAGLPIMSDIPVSDESSLSRFQALAGEEGKLADFEPLGDFAQANPGFEFRVVGTVADESTDALVGLYENPFLRDLNAKYGQNPNNVQLRIFNNENGEVMKIANEADFSDISSMEMQGSAISNLGDVNDMDAQEWTNLVVEQGEEEILEAGGEMLFA